MKKSITFRLIPKLIAQLKNEAIINDRSMTNMLEKILTDYFTKKN